MENETDKEATVSEILPAIPDVQEAQVMRAPALVLQEAQKAAAALKDVIDSKPRAVKFGGEVYLEFEDWQLLGQFYGYQVKTGEATGVEINGVAGARAIATLYDRNGVEIGGAEAYCMRDEDNWRQKPWYQLASMSQTRAGAKALRNRLAWVAVLAGYRPTPAEEMAGVGPDRPERTVVEGDTSEFGICQIHHIPFFMKGKMRTPAHKNDDNTWCNKPDAAPTTKAAAPATTQAAVLKKLREIVPDPKAAIQWCRDEIPRLAENYKEWTDADWQRIGEVIDTVIASSQENADGVYRNV